MDIQQLKEWATFAGAVTAAIVSSINLFLKFRENRENIHVGFGPTSPPIAPGEWLHIKNKSTHPVRILDYGFISESGIFTSYPDSETNDPHSFDEVVVGGSLDLGKWGDIFELGYVPLHERPIAAYAVVVGKKGCFIGFDDNVSFWKRLQIRLLILKKRLLKQSLFL